MSDQFIDVLLKCSQAKSFERLEVIQRLWSGYGTISRYALEDGTNKTVVVKHITLNKADTHPRGWNSNNSHMRKVRSYEVEMRWYQSWNQRCYVNCKTPKFLGSFSDRDEKWIILEDLDKEFPLRKSQVTFAEVKLCLSWLAHFHAAFLGEAPTGLWPVGTYWHLETRPDELGKLSHKRLKENAQFIDRKLNECSFKTIVHGDAKLANFCFSKNSLKVAAVDFQYVGGGCGIKDVAYFLGSCMSGEECELYEEELLKSF